MPFAAPQCSLQNKTQVSEMKEARIPSLPSPPSLGPHLSLLSLCPYLCDLETKNSRDWIDVMPAFSSVKDDDTGQGIVYRMLSRILLLFPGFRQ